MRGLLRPSALFLSALVPAACLELSEVEAGERDSSAVGGGAGSGGIPGDAWQLDEEAGGSAGTDATAPTDFPARGVVFDGVDDWLELAGPFSGVADSQKVTGSIWFKRTGTGSLYCIGPEAAGAGDHNQMEWTPTNRFRVSWRRAGGGFASDMQTASAISDTVSWHHIAFSIDVTNVDKTRLYVDGVLDLETGYSVAGYDMDHTGSQWGLFAENTGLLKYQGEVAELWLDLDRYIDLSVPTNLEKFRSPDGKPVDLGTNGELPTGTVPAVYLSIRNAEAPSFFGTNRGSGGDFTLHGTLAVSATSPGP